MLTVLISILNALRIKMKMVLVFVLALSEQHRSALGYDDILGHGYSANPASRGRTG
jgi:hypothetical protein